MNFLFVTLVLTAVSSTGFASRIVCYYNNQKRYGPEAFMVEDIDPTLCTHIVYTFYGLDNSQIVSRDIWNDIGDQWNKGGLERFLDLKKKNPTVKLLIGVGGPNEGPLAFIQMVQTQQNRTTFLNSCLRFLGMYRFDGVEIDWVYTDPWGGSEDAKQGFSLLVREMKSVFDSMGYVLAIGTSPFHTIVKNSYDLPALSKYVDYIHVMTYDYHASWEKYTGHMAPLHMWDDLSVNSTIASYIREFGANPEKLNIGLASFGPTFTLKVKGCTDYRADTIGRGHNDPMPYRKFCEQDKANKWTKLRNDFASVPYAVAGDQWVGLDDIRSMTDKVKYAKSQRLGGISFWSLDADDFRGKCGSVRFPLLRAARTEMLN